MTQTFEEAIWPLYDSYVKIATKWCFGDVHKAEDMVQEAMIKAFIHYHEYDGSCKITTWFHKILHNTVMDANKIENRVRERYQDYFIWKGAHEPSYSLDLTEEEDLYKDMLDSIPRLIHRLPKTDQTIIKMYMAGEEHSKIGRVIGTTRGAITKRIRRICKQLHEELANKI